MSDRDGLRRRAEVLQRVADQLSAQLRVERWSNGELRKLLGEPDTGDLEDDRAAAKRFLTFAAVAVVTAAAVALVASSPWRGRDTLPSSEVALSGAAASLPTAPAFGGTIIPFTVVSAAVPDVDSTVPVVGAQPAATARTRMTRYGTIDPDEIFRLPASRVRLTPPTGRPHRSDLFLTADDIWPGPSGRVTDVP